MRLKGKTRHGKNRIQEHGEIWSEIFPVTWIQGKPNKKFIKSNKTGDERWLDLEHFEIISDD